MTNSNLTIYNQDKFHYPNYFSLHPQVFLNKNIEVAIKEDIVDVITKYDTETGAPKGKARITMNGRNKLRPYDQDVITALLWMLGNKDTFADVDFEGFAKVTNKDEQKDTPKAKELAETIARCCTMRCTLEEIFETLEIRSMQKRNLDQLEEAMNNLKFIGTTSRTYSMEHSDEDIYYQRVGSSDPRAELEARGILADFKIGTISGKSDVRGHVTFDRLLIKDILQGKHTILDFAMLKCFPRGAARKFYRFVASRFSNYFSTAHLKETGEGLDEVVEPYEQFVKKVLGLQYSQSRRLLHEFTKCAKLLEKRGVLEPGFSLPKKLRTYELITKDEDGVEWLHIRKGPHLRETNQELTVTDTMKKDELEDRLSGFGFTDDWVELFVRACTKQTIKKPISEKGGKRKFYVDPRLGLVIEEEGQETDFIELTWDSLETFSDFVDLFFVYHEKRKLYKSKAGVFRSIIFDRKFYSRGELDRLKGLEKEEAARKTAAKTDAAKKKYNDEKAEKERLDQEEREKLASAFEAKFNKLIRTFESGIDSVGLYVSALKSMFPEKEFPLWFSGCIFLKRDNTLYCVLEDLMTCERLKRHHLQKISRKLSEDIGSVEIFVKEEFYAHFADDPTDEASTVGLYETPENYGQVYGKLRAIYEKDESKVDMINFSVFASIRTKGADVLKESERDEFYEFLKDANSIGESKRASFFELLETHEADILQLLKIGGIISE